jgi:LacI family transcriptional regulator
VAISSVSRVLTGHAAVSERMRERVQKAVGELGYEPDHLAQSLRSGATHTIGFMMRDIANPFFSMVAQSCESELRKSNFSMILVNSSGDVETEYRNFILLNRRRVDGVIASLVSEDAPHVRRIISESHSPIVLLDREVSGLYASSVLCDHKTGSYEATIDLLHDGHTRIAFISGRKDVYVTRNRYRGYEEAFKELKLKVPIDLVKLKEFTENFAYEEVFRLMRLAKPPTAIIAGGIGASVGVLKALKELDLKIGKDVSLVALDEWPYFDVLSDHIPSVYRNPELVGRNAARLILDQIVGLPPRSVVIPTEYRSRKSTRKRKNVKAK